MVSDGCGVCACVVCVVCVHVLYMCVHMFTWGVVTEVLYMCVCSCGVWSRGVWSHVHGDLVHLLRELGLVLLFDNSELSH